MRLGSRRFHYTNVVKDKPCLVLLRLVPAFSETSRNPEALLDPFNNPKPIVILLSPAERDQFLPDQLSFDSLPHSPLAIFQFRSFFIRQFARTEECGCRTRSLMRVWGRIIINEGFAYRPFGDVSFD